MGMIYRAGEAAKDAWRSVTQTVWKGKKITPQDEFDNLQTTIKECYGVTITEETIPQGIKELKEGQTDELREARVRAPTVLGNRIEKLQELQSIFNPPSSSS